MHQIYRLQVNNYSVAEIKEALKLDNQIELKNSQLGKQPDDAFILGQFLSESETTVSNNKSRKQIILKEVLEDGILANKFEVFIYGDQVNSFNACMSKLRRDTCWLLFRKVTLAERHRFDRRGWNSQLIRLFEEDRSDCIVVAIFRDDQSVCRELRYTTIDGLQNKKKYNVLAVVVEVMKDEQLTRHGSRHSMFAITDPTWADINGILLHVFFNRQLESLPCTVEAGDIIRIREMTVECYYANNPSGKVYSPNAIQIFKKEDGCISVYSNKADYIYTKNDQDRVIELMSWNSDKLRTSVPKKVQSEYGRQQQTELKDLSEINSHCCFDLECQIVLMKDVPKHDTVLLRVVDGTTCNIYINQLDFDDPTNSLNSQTDRAVYKPRYIDIVVFHPLAEAQKLKPNDIVRLCNIQCCEIADFTMNTTDPILLFDFQMDVAAKIVPLNVNCGSVREIQRRIKDKHNGIQEKDYEPDSQNSFIKLARNIVNGEYSAILGRKSTEYEPIQTEAVIHDVPQKFSSTDKPLRSRDETTEESSDANEPPRKYLCVDETLPKIRGEDKTTQNSSNKNVPLRKSPRIDNTQKLPSKDKTPKKTPSKDKTPKKIPSIDKTPQKTTSKKISTPESLNKDRNYQKFQNKDKSPLQSQKKDSTQRTPNKSETNQESSSKDRTYEILCNEKNPHQSTSKDTTPQKNTRKDKTSSTNNQSNNLPSTSQSHLRSNDGTKSTDSSVYMLGPTPEKDPDRRIIASKSPYSANREELHFLQNEDSEADTSFHSVTSDMTLSQYLENKLNVQPTPLRLCILKVIGDSFIPNPKGGLAANLVWGLCVNCGVVYSSVALRESFLTEDLLGLESLNCLHCQGKRKRKRASGSGASIIPYFLATLILCDPDEPEVMVEAIMNGTEAETYFGLKSLFKYVLAEENEDLRSVLHAKFRTNSIIDLCLVRRQSNCHGIYVQ